MLSERDALAQLETAAKVDPFTARMYQRFRVTSYEEFLSLVHDELLLAVGRLEANPQVHHKKSEDEVTQSLVDMLEAAGYRTSHNKQSGGNVDLTIEMVLPKAFRWIAEAKWFDDIGDLREGYLQLATRYRPGTDGTSRLYGGLLGYLRRPNAASCMANWRMEWERVYSAPGVKTVDCVRRGPLAFVSEHTHESYGLPISIWHLSVALHFEPKDKSARNAKKYRNQPQKTNPL